MRAKKKEKLRREVEKVKLQKITEERNTPATEKDVVSLAKASDFDAKKTYENVCMEINRGNFDGARNLARAISGSDTKKYAFFITPSPKKRR